MKKPIHGKEDLVTWCKQNNKIELLSEWDYDRNEFLPEDYYPKSEKTVFWKCEKEQHSYSAPICFRTIHDTKCCYCSGRRVLPGFNDLKSWCEKNGRVDLLKEWSVKKNEESPEDVTKTSHKRIEWECLKCKKTYSAYISDRVAKGSGCPYCAGRLPIVGKNDLMTWCRKNERDDLIKDWAEDLNQGRSMTDYTYASNKKVIWKCNVCANVWKAAVYSRTVGNRGCSNCKVAGTSFPEQFIFLTMKSIFPQAKNRDTSIGVELDVFLPQLEIAIEYNGYYYHYDEVHKKADDNKRSLCEKEGIALLQIVEIVEGNNGDEGDYIRWRYSRDKNELVNLTQRILRWMENKSGCEIEKEQIEWNQIYKDARERTYNVEYKNSLEYKSPGISVEWDYIRNEGIKPSQVSNGSKDLCYWVCSKCGTPFAMKINDRTRKKGAGCPKCGKEKQIESWIKNRTRVKSFSDWCIENDRCDLLNEWNNDKNISQPSNYPSGSNQEVWWKCKQCGHEWEAKICNRRKTGCPICSKNKRGIPVLQYKDGALIAEFSSLKEAYEKTGISPKTIRKVLQGKHKEAKGYEWQLKIKDNTEK